MPYLVARPKPASQPFFIPQPCESAVMPIQKNKSHEWKFDIHSGEQVLEIMVAGFVTHLTKPIHIQSLENAQSNSALYRPAKDQESN
jgi:hypothetical protein